jgi:hypothetical protein
MKNSTTIKRIFFQKCIIDGPTNPRGIKGVAVVQKGGSQTFAKHEKGF